MSNYARDFASFMDAEGIKYSETDNENVLRVVYAGENLTTIPVFVVFEEEDVAIVQLKCWNIANFNNKREEALAVCNEMNVTYRWVKFCLDSDNDIVATIDAAFSPTTCGADCFHLIRRLIQIVDDAYPTFAKARWA